MESYVIEFYGELSKKCKNGYFKILVRFLYVFSLIVLTIIGVPLVVIGMKFGFLLYVLLFLMIVFIVCLLAPIGFKAEQNKIFPVKIIIENGEIAALNSEQVSKLKSESDSIESLCFDGAFITSIKPISEVVKVIDYGEWYYIFFNSGHMVTNYICQKDLIINGSIDEFEKLFKGKIQIKKNKIRQNNKTK